MKKFRKEKINELLKRELSELIMKEVKDPRVQGFVTVTEVDISKDMKSAKVYVSIFGIDENEKKKCFKGLQSSENYLSYRISKNIRLRYTPHLTFYIDDSLEKGFNIIDKLNSIKNKEKTASDD